MALINNLYVFVQDENIKRATNIPQHPVEKGLPLSDSVRNTPLELSIRGKIVNTEKESAATILSTLDKLRKNGSLITYKGRNVINGNFMIKSFNTSHPNTVWGGADFDMDLVEVRTAKSAYVEKPKNTNTAETKKPTLAVGATVVFKGGAVYVSSDATKAAANRGRQTCKITKISTKSWSIHQYHLISVDKSYPNNVYGWVDLANIEGSGATSTTPAVTPTNSTATTKKPSTTNTKPKTNAGTKQATEYKAENAGQKASGKTRDQYDSDVRKKQEGKTETKSKTETKPKEPEFKNSVLEKRDTLTKDFTVGDWDAYSDGLGFVGGEEFYIDGSQVKITSDVKDMETIRQMYRYFKPSDKKTKTENDKTVYYFPKGTQIYRQKKGALEAKKNPTETTAFDRAHENVMDTIENNLLAWMTPTS